MASNKGPRKPVLIVYTERVYRNAAGYAAPRSIADRIGALDFKLPANAEAVAWPVSGRYVKADGTAKAKAHNSRVARNDAESVAAVVDRVVAQIAAGGEVYLWVREGCVLSNMDGVFPTVAGPESLMDVAKHASKVAIAEGAEDPRDFVEDDNESTIPF